MTQPAKLTIDIYSDVMCPWCIIGYKQLEKGLAQLEGEIERDDWIVLSALPSDVLVPPRVDLWSRVLRRQPQPMALMATHPIDLSRN